MCAAVNLKRARSALPLQSPPQAASLSYMTESAGNVGVKRVVARPVSSTSGSPVKHQTKRKKVYTSPRKKAVVSLAPPSSSLPDDATLAYTSPTQPAHTAHGDPADSLECAEEIDAFVQQEIIPFEKAANDVPQVAGKTGQPICDLSIVLEWDNDPTIAGNMRTREKRYQPNPQYMEFQDDIDLIMRAILLDWMIEVSQEFSLGRESLYMAANFVDRFLSVFTNLPKDKLQLLGVTCLFISTKLEEIHPPKCTDFAVTTDGAYTVKDIFNMERDVLRVLEWRLMPQTPLAFLKLFIKQISIELKKQIEQSTGCLVKRRVELVLDHVVSAKVFCRCMTIIDVSLHDVAYLNYYPSMLAAAALILVEPKIEDMVKEISGYMDAEISPCRDYLHQFAEIADRPMLESSPVYISLKVPEEDMYGRQPHNPQSLQLFRAVNKHMIQSSVLRPTAGQTQALSSVAVVERQHTAARSATASSHQPATEQKQAPTRLRRKDGKSKKSHRRKKAKTPLNHVSVGLSPL